MFVVAVEFDIHEESVEAFKEAVLIQSKNSMEKEAACTRFDVCQDAAQANRFFLYEIYNDAAAFEAHRQTPHFADFSSKITDMVAEKFLQTWTIIS